MRELATAGFTFAAGIAAAHWLLPAAWLLSLSGQLPLVWWAFPLAELFSMALCALFHRHVYRREIRPLMGPAKER